MAKRVPTDDELALWQQTIADVKPHMNSVAKNVRVEPAKPPGDAPPKPEAFDPDAIAVPTDEPKPPQKTWLSRERTHTKATDLSAAGMDRRTMQRLRKGNISIEGKIDLHGMRQDEAHIELQRFIESCQRSGKRMVLVVTGRGARDDGVLKRMAPRWLSSAPISRNVIAVSRANPSHGGEGALYVQLRRPHR